MWLVGLGYYALLGELFSNSLKWKKYKDVNVVIILML